jgi:(2S)-methylsuccinyl-CoA dehydrogenase
MDAPMELGRGNDLVRIATNAAEAAKELSIAAKNMAAHRVMVNDKPDPRQLDAEQRATHAYAWMATTAGCLEATVTWANKLSNGNGMNRVDECTLAIGFSEYLGQLAGGLPMGQNEIVRPHEFGLAAEAEKFVKNSAVSRFLQQDGKGTRAELTQSLSSGLWLSDSVEDETIDLFRSEIRKFADERIIPGAHGWHLKDELIPDEIVSEMAGLGIFGICIDPAHGGLGMGKLAMCVVTEELSRAWIAAGSLGTRSEIAGELISIAGTEAQKQKWLPKIASGEILPTAVFTEPDTGSDLGSLKTRAVKSAVGAWSVTGAKTWITHAARSDLMTVLARTNPDSKSHDGLSMFIAEKPRGTRENPFPAKGMSGSEIEVLGYRGMREYTIGFDDFAVAEDGLLGGAEGQGFRQLMKTFEGARIQTAARAVGVARRALELGLKYANDRKQFGKPIAEFPRVSDKLAMMTAEILMSREMTYSAARKRDSGERCDIEAGMAKFMVAMATR